MQPCAGITFLRNSEFFPLRRPCFSVCDEMFVIFPFSESSLCEWLLPPCSAATGHFFQEQSAVNPSLRSPAYFTSEDGRNKNLIQIYWLSQEEEPGFYSTGLFVSECTATKAVQDVQEIKHFVQCRPGLGLCQIFYILQ